MIINKAILGGALACLFDDKTDVCSIEPDGTIVASNRLLLYISEPVKTEVLNRIPFGDHNPLKEACIFPKSAIEMLFKSIQKDTLFKGILEHASISLIDRPLVNIETRSGTQSQHFELRRINRPIGDWKKVFMETWQGTALPSPQRFIYNRARLESACNALSAACKYDGQFAPVFIEPSGQNKILWRSVNELTGQRVWIIFTSTEIKEEWLSLGNWEKSIIEPIKKITRKI
jgi:hypothetical protein